MKNKKRNLSPANHPSKSQSPVQVTGQAFSGPIPPAHELERYAAINPELVNRIMAMAEQEAATRHKLESIKLEANIQISNKQFSERKLGQYFGFGIGVCALACSAYLGFIGAQTAASIVGGTTVVGLAGVFVTGQYLSKDK